MATIVFQPCPAHFPDLWKEATLGVLEPIEEHIAAAKQMYLLPEDGTNEAATLCGIWGVDSTQDIARAYARVWFCTPHGFLVLDGRCIGPNYAIHSLTTLRRLRDEIDVPDACEVRAVEFGLPEQDGRQSFASAMGSSQRNYRYCRPAAQHTWPYPNGKKLRERVQRYRCAHNSFATGPLWITYCEAWFVAQRLGLE